MTKLRIPTGRRHTSWLFTRRAEKLNLGLPRTILTRTVRTGFEADTYGCQIQRSNHSVTLPLDPVLTKLCMLGKYPPFSVRFYECWFLYAKNCG